jgi:heme oxygenase
MNFTESLKAATTNAHQYAESRDLQRLLIRGVLAEHVLASYLAQLRRVHGAIESMFDLHQIWATSIEWSDSFRHTRRLDSDLANLSATQDELEPNLETERLLDAIERLAAEEPASLLGLFYVLEGSMNGNRFIVRSLRKSSTARRCSFDYFDPYGEQQPQRWAIFKANLERAGSSLNESQQRRVVEAALTMFNGIARICDELTSTAIVVTCDRPTERLSAH